MIRYRQPAIFVSICLTLLLGCSVPAAKPLPTLVPLANTPVLPSPQPESTANSASRVRDDPAEPSGHNLSRITPDAPTPGAAGIRPQEARLIWVPDAGPDATSIGRPPPMAVPLALHPDDHYWLMRPIPSRSRNYELEWYPFGNDVLRADLDAYRIHHGIDLPNDTGTPVLASGSGTVLHAGPLPSPLNGVNYYGNTVIVQHDWQWQGKDVFTLYAHTLELFVTVGEWVDQGQLIAGVGSSGEVSGPHLHLEVRIGQNQYGNARNPALWLAPFEGMGTVAGRFVDRNGRFITSAPVRLRPVQVNTPARSQLTYYGTVGSDEVWRENFVFGDVPAGEYELLLTGLDNIQYKRDIVVYPGRTSFDIISANYEFNPTPTPEPLPTSEPTTLPETSQ